MNRFSLVILFVAVLFICGTKSIFAQTTHCTQITSLPYTISTGGVYCVTKNLSTTASGIQITANNVVLDLNGFTLSDTAGADTAGAGIFANSQKNITVRNGSVRGFYIGIALYDLSPFTVASANVVEDMRVTGSRYVGIESYGAATIIRNNQIVKTGGSAQKDATQGKAIGIDIRGVGAEVSNNFIDDTFGTGGSSYAIFLVGDDGIALNNRMVTADYGVNSSETGECRDNVAIAVTNKYPGCVDLGNNN
jgi:hypothetical protein